MEHIKKEICDKIEYELLTDQATQGDKRYQLITDPFEVVPERTQTSAGARYRVSITASGDSEGNDIPWYRLAYQRRAIVTLYRLDGSAIELGSSKYPALLSFAPRMGGFVLQIEAISPTPYII